MIKVQLTRKLAAILNGIDVSSINIGDILELPDAAAKMLIAEGWATRVSKPVLGPLNVPSKLPSAETP